jgi:hypothetical protein
MGLLVAGVQSSPAANSVPGYGKVARSLALIGFPVRNSSSKLQIAFGTGFVVTSNDRTSTLITANHVIAPLANNVEPGLFVILPTAPGVRQPAAVVKHDQDLDIAVVSINVGGLTPVKVSKDVPEKGDHVAIAGFPFAEVCGLAGMCGDDFLAPHAHKGELHDELSAGDVSDAQAGQYSIMINNVVADHGNSGGPLFDADTGIVYGIITDALRGYSDNLTPPQVYQNRAIAMNVGLAFISGPPSVAVSIDGIATRGPGGAPVDTYSVGGRGTPACVAAWKTFDAAYGEWLQAHGLLESLAQYASRPEYRQRIAELQATAARVPGLQSAALARMQASRAVVTGERGIRIGAAQAAVLAVLEPAASNDAALAASLTLPNGLATAHAVEARLGRTAKAMDAIVSCS